MFNNYNLSLDNNTDWTVLLTATTYASILLTSITKVDIESCVGPLLTNLFAVMDIPASAENEYVMKGRLFSVSINP